MRRDTSPFLCGGKVLFMCFLFRLDIVRVNVLSTSSNFHNINNKVDEQGTANDCEEAIGQRLDEKVNRKEN